jgi:hypothetical protein
MPAEWLEQRANAMNEVPIDLGSFLGCQASVTNDLDAFGPERGKQLSPPVHLDAEQQAPQDRFDEHPARGVARELRRANHHEIIEVRADNRQELDTFEQGSAVVLCFLEETFLKPKEAEFPIVEQGRIVAEVVRRSAVVGREVRGANVCTESRTVGCICSGD